MLATSRPEETGAKICRGKEGWLGIERGRQKTVRRRIMKFECNDLDIEIKLYMRLELS